MWISMNKWLTIDLFHWVTITIKNMYVNSNFVLKVCTDVHTLMNYIPCFVVFSKSIYPARHALHLRFHEIFSKHMNNFDNPVTLGSKHKLSEGIAWQRSVVARFTIKHSRYTIAHCYNIAIICPMKRKVVCKTWSFLRCTWQFIEMNDLLPFPFLGCVTWSLHKKRVVFPIDTSYGN